VAASTVSDLRPAGARRPLVGITGPRIHAAQISTTPAILLHAFTDAYYACYAQAIARAGGLPVHVPRDNDARAVCARLDAVVLAGGQDVDPRLYEREPSAAATMMDPARDRFEIDLALAALDQDRPLLGICRGAQVLNVALGGTLIDDLAGEQEIEHTVVLYPPDARVHPVRFVAGSALADVYGPEIWVNSFHHQGIGGLGDGVRATGLAPDRIIEGIEIDGARAVGVQWHPEMLAEPDPLLTWLIDQADERGTPRASREGTCREHHN
jgi:putative glutamine amidotransferase